MKLGIVLNTNHPETAWNALRLGSTAIDAGNQVKVFLLGSGVEIEDIKDKRFDVIGLLKNFAKSEAPVLACGSCLRIRNREPGVVLKSTMSELVKMIDDSDKMVTFG